MGFAWAIRDLFVEQMSLAGLESESVGASIAGK
jgi:hypothetical protein